MKADWKIPKSEKLVALLGQYKFVLIAIAAGIMLLAWPSDRDKASAAEASGLAGTEEDFSVDALEERLGKALSKVDGAGEVLVILTVQTGMERVLATNRSVEQTSDSRNMGEDIVVISGKGGEEALLIRQNYPTFQGALLICSGGEDPSVRLQLTEAVSALTGLGADRIAICSGS